MQDLDQRGIHQGLRVLFGGLSDAPVRPNGRGGPFHCSVDERGPESLTVTLEVQESYKLLNSDEVTTSSYRESVVLGLENGEVVFLRASMDEQKIGKLTLLR